MGSDKKIIELDKKIKSDEKIGSGHQKIFRASSFKDFRLNSPLKKARDKIKIEQC